ncbi:helix-turn-helix domain-containing protein [Streptomyces mirabilis]
MGDSRLQPLVLSEDERLTLQGWVKRRTTAQGLAKRARIVLACANGLSNTAVAARLDTDRGTVRRWRTRFLPGPARRPVRRTTSRRAPHHLRRPGGRGGGTHPRRGTRGRHGAGDES